MVKKEERSKKEKLTMSRQSVDLIKTAVISFSWLGAIATSLHLGHFPIGLFIIVILITLRIVEV